MNGPTDVTPRSGFSPSLLLSSIVGGAIAGAIYAGIVYVIKWDFFLIFPVAIGYVIYFLMQKVQVKEVIRSSSMLMLVGTIGLVVAFVTQQGVSAYLSREREISDLYKLATDDGYKITREDAAEAIDMAYDEETGYKGVVGAFVYSLQNSSISSGHSLDQDNAIKVGIIGGVIMLLVEIGIAGAVLFGQIKSQLSAPFCEACNRWKQKRPLAVVGSFADLEAVKNALANKDFEGLKQINANAKKGKTDFTRLHVYACPGCSGDVELKIEGYGRKGKLSKMVNMTLKESYPLTRKELTNLTVALGVEQPML